MISYNIPPFNLLHQLLNIPLHLLKNLHQFRPSYLMNDRQLRTVASWKNLSVKIPADTAIALSS